MLDAASQEIHSLKSKQHDAFELADLIENDWLTKLDKLTDLILDQQDEPFDQFTKGLMTAYKLMQGYDIKTGGY